MYSRHIFLVGPMGAGKSTLGEPLAKRLKRPFYDMDAMIVSKGRRSIPDIFEHDGECTFRAMESALLAELCKRDTAAVIATGGGVIISAPNRLRMQQNGIVIWLDVPPDVAAARIRGDRNRPLLSGVNPLHKARELDVLRRPLYRASSRHAVRVDKLSPHDSVNDILTFLTCSPDGLM